MTSHSTSNNPTALIKSLYRDACFGAGAMVRKAARIELRTEAKRGGFADIGDLLRFYSLDVHAFFATAPI